MLGVKAATPTLPAEPSNPSADLLKQHHTRSEPDHAELVRAPPGSTSFQHVPSQPAGAWIPVTDDSGFTCGANSPILMRFPQKSREPD